MKIFIGNLSYNVTETDLRHLFETFGQVTSTTIEKYPGSQRSKGFGFVEMPETTEARAAIMSLNGQPFRGRTITTNEARSDEDAVRGKDLDGLGDRRGRGRY